MGYRVQAVEKVRAYDRNYYKYYPERWYIDYTKREALSLYRNEMGLKYKRVEILAADLLNDNHEYFQDWLEEQCNEEV